MITALNKTYLQKHRLTRSKNGGNLDEERSVVSFEELPRRLSKDDIIIVGHLGSSLDSQSARTQLNH